MRVQSLLLAVVVMACSGGALADGPDASSGFLSDYALLKPSVMGQLGQYIYVAPDARQRLAVVNAIYVEQPAIAIAPDSKVKALQPNDAQLIANTFQQLLTEQLAPSYTMAARSDRGVLTLRTALTNVYLQKPGRRLLSYTPTGILVHAAKNALEGVMQKVDLHQAVIQAELLDGDTSAVIAEVYDQKGSIANKDQYTDWQQVEDAFTADAKRLSCQLHNAHSPPEQQTNCWQSPSP
jgi:Protein of unknown function (DUF3313)